MTGPSRLLQLTVSHSAYRTTGNDRSACLTAASCRESLTTLKPSCSFAALIIQQPGCTQDVSETVHMNDCHKWRLFIACHILPTVFHSLTKYQSCDDNNYCSTRTCTVVSPNTSSTTTVVPNIAVVCWLRKQRKTPTSVITWVSKKPGTMWAVSLHRLYSPTTIAS